MGSDGALYISYHNSDIDAAFRLSLLLLRCYRRVWMDRLEIAPSQEWTAGIRQARTRAKGALVVVTNQYLNSRNCRAEYELLAQRGIPLTAVIAGDVATDQFGEYEFNDWMDFRRWFEDPSDQSAETLLSRIPQSESALQPGERLEYLRGFIHETELALTTMPTSWAALRNADAVGGGDIRPRNALLQALGDWEYTASRPGAQQPLDDLRGWAQSEAQFALRGAAGSGKSTFARLLALEQAHLALRNANEALPIWLDLALWDESPGSLDAFIESQWRLVTFWQRWLEQHTSLIVLDNFNDLYQKQPQAAAAVLDWIASSPRQRYILLSRDEPGLELDLPTVDIGAANAGMAQRFASHHLTLRQQNDFRQLLRGRERQIDGQPLAYVALGVELLAADRALAHSQWIKDPLPALIALRLQQMPGAARGLSALQLLRALQNLAWTMMLADDHSDIQRDAAETQIGDQRVIAAALDLGLMRQSGALLRFQPALLQGYLAAEPLRRDGLIKFIAAPAFSADGLRLPRKWDALALLILAGLADDSRVRALEHIADIDPFLAATDLRRGAPSSDALQETLVDNILRIGAGDSKARPAGREALKHIPAAETTAQLLISRLGQYDSATQLWLWQEIRALPLDLPLDFISLAADIDRSVGGMPPARLADFPLALAAAWLVKLSAHPDADLRRNALWLLGEMKYLPTAILLLDDLQHGADTDRGEVLSALMKFAYSEILARVLRWSQAHQQHCPAVVKALRERKRLVTGRLLDLAHGGKLTLHDDFYELAATAGESDIAIGLAQIAADHIDLPEAVETALLTHRRAEELRQQVDGAIKHLPSRENFALLRDDIAAVLRDPPDGTVLAGSKLEALVYGQSPFASDRIEAAATPPALPIELRQQLQHDDWQQRHRGINALAGYASEQSLPHLLDACDDDDSRVRLAAYSLLARLDGESAAEIALLPALADPDADVVREVTKLLKSQTNLDYDALLDLLESDKPQFIAAAIDILGDARYQPAVRDLTRLLNSPLSLDDDTTISQLARAALEAIGESARDEPSGQPTPAPGFSDADKIRRTLDVLRDDDWGRTQKAARFLRKFARHLRGGENQPVLDLLCAALEDDNWSVRWAVAEALAVLKNPAASPFLRKRLSDPSWIVQTAAARALAELRAVDCASDIALLLQSPQSSLREAAAEALGILRQPQVIPALGESMRRDDDEFVRLAALKAIHSVNPPQARQWLELALHDDSLALRHFALRALTPHLDESDLPMLRQMLDDSRKPPGEDQSLHDLAVSALRAIDSPTSRALLTEPAALERASA